MASAEKGSAASKIPSTPKIVRPGVQSVTVGGSTFEINERYRVIKPIGHGAYGVVVSAEDKKTDKKVAIKKIPNWHQDLTDAKRILREVRLMRHFAHENIVGLEDLEVPPSFDKFDDMYLMSELMETDLHRIIYSGQELTDDHVQFFIYYILCALKYMHSVDIIHRDLKPSNVLLNADCTLKLCDFGLARGVELEVGGDLTEYVVTRWYRAPEVMLSCQEYSKAIDIWSVGCIFAEILGGRPLFPGDNYVHQLKIIVEVLGSPPEGQMDFITNGKAKEFMLKLNGKKGRPFRELFPDASKEAIDLLEKMLEFHPGKRITVDEALAHPYLASLHSPEDEPVCTKPVDFAFEEVHLAEEIKAAMLEDIAALHDEANGLIEKAKPVVAAAQAEYKRKKEARRAAKAGATAAGAKGDGEGVPAVGGGT